MIGITHLMIDDLRSSDFPIYHTSMPYWGIFPFSIEIYRSSWSHMILTAHGMHDELIVYCYLIMIPQWSLFRAIKSGSYFPAFRYHHASSFGRRPWCLGLIRLWIWVTEITHLMMDDLMLSNFRFIPYWGIFHLRWDSRIFMESHNRPHLRDTCWDENLFIILSWSSSGALLEPFSQARICRHSDVVILPLLRYAFVIRESDSVMDVDD